MARSARVIITGQPHHVHQSAAKGRTLFTDDVDRDAYLHHLRKCAAEHDVEVLAYSLLPDAIHLVVVPHNDDGLAMVLRRVHSSHSRFINDKTKKKGNIWQDRFASCPLDDDWLWAAVKYVERQPLVTKLTKRIDLYAWASAKAHCGRGNDDLLSGKWPSKSESSNWTKWLKEPQDAEEILAIEQSTRTGKPLGDVKPAKKAPKKAAAKKTAKRGRAKK